MDGSGDGQMMVRWSGEVQMRVKSQKYFELDIAMYWWTYDDILEKGVLC